MTEVYIAIVMQIGTLLGLLITAIYGKRKIGEVHDLVNGTSSKQLAEIAYLKAQLERRKPGRPKKETPPP